MQLPFVSLEWTQEKTRTLEKENIVSQRIIILWGKEKAPKEKKLLVLNLAEGQVIQGNHILLLKSYSVILGLA